VLHCGSLWVRLSTSWASCLMAAAWQRPKWPSWKAPVLCAASLLQGCRSL
jgi:hypothetical protein